MKKRTNRYYWIHCRKWIVTWTILILILSFISLSAGLGNDTESHDNSGKDSDSNSVSDKDTQNGENTEETLKAEEETEDSTDNQETSDIQDSENHEESSKASNSTEDQKSSVNTLKTVSDSEGDTDNQESTEEDLKANEETEDSTETVTEKDTGSQENLEEETEIDTETEQDTESQENIEENSDKEVENGSTDSQKSSGENQVTTTETEQDSDDQVTTEENSEVQTSSKDNVSSQESTEEPSETETKTETVTDDQESSVTNEEAGNAESSCKCTSQKENTEETSDGSSEYSGTKTEEKTGSDEDSTNQEDVDTESDGEGNSEENNLENYKLQVNNEGNNSSYVTESNESKTDKSEKNSWYHLQYILSYVNSLRPFYTTNENVKINYKGPEALNGQKVDIYLIKARSPSFSEEDIKNLTTDNTINFEDIFSQQPEYYTRIPATLNTAGDLSPMTLAPLSEGSYWVLITLAENETKTSGHDKNILLAHYFKVMEYEMRAETPRTLEDGENLEVNLIMKNAPVQDNYTYCALLMREDTEKTTNTGTYTNGTETVSGTFAQGLKIIEYLGFNETNYESITDKDRFKEEIQDLLGKNGTISIGEEGQKTLSMTTSDLQPGNYLLLTGAYEKGKGLESIARTEISILEDKKSTGSESNTNLSKENQRYSALADASSALGLEELEPQIRESVVQATEVIKNPPKLPSFLVGFVGTLLIGIAILNRRR